jgi:hypothetical protein
METFAIECRVMRDFYRREPPSGDPRKLLTHHLDSAIWDHVSSLATLIASD